MADLARDGSLFSFDVTDQDRQRRLQQLESIFDDSGDVIFLLDSEKRFRAWNRAAERILGWSASEILGQSVKVIVPAHLVQAGELERIDEEIVARGNCHLETVRLAKDGRQVPVELTLSLLRDSQGQPVGRSVILRDITERKRLEEAKLQSERLAVIGAMSAKLAHEIRNPLSSIRLNLDLVGDEFKSLSGRCPEAAQEAGNLLRAIDAEVLRIQRVTEDYLLFARMPKPHWERVALNELLTQGLEFMQSLFDTSRVTLRTEFDPALPAVRGDEEQLWQAALNLVRNALEAMPEGGTLTVRTACDSTDVTLTISDTGKGMTEVEQRQVFHPFFSTKPGGTGLGLPLAQQIIGEHGGSISCKSVAGQGATFLIHLPCWQEISSHESKHPVD